MRVHHQISWSSIVKISSCLRIMASSVFLNRRLFRLMKISRNYFSPDRRLFRLAYVSRHYRYYHITIYFGPAKISRHRYSSHIVRYLIIVAYDGSTIYHGYSAISVSEASSHRILPGKPNDPFVSSLSCSVNRTILRLVSYLSWFGKPIDTSAREVAVYPEIVAHRGS